MKIELSPDQEIAAQKILTWYKDPMHPVFALVGYAGTGKTTLAAYLRNKIEGNIAYVSFTGKAASVLRSKLQGQVTLREGDHVGTIHSLIYTMISAKGDSPTFSLRSSLDQEIDLIVVDEASMIGEGLFEDLTSFGIPILFIGDDAQLPPINDEIGSHLLNPDAKLEKIHRQAEGNPIISFSKNVRENKGMACKKYSDNVEVLSLKTSEGKDRLKSLKVSYDVKKDMFLCGFNNTRLVMNNDIRSILGFYAPEPLPGDRVICLRNNREKKIYNGMVGVVEEILEETTYKDTQKNPHKSYKIAITFGERVYKGWCLAHQFNNKASFHKTLENIKKASDVALDLFDFGYCVSVHKAQGSEFSNVVIIREVCDLWEQKKWDYTAVTRAVDSLTVFV